MDPLNKSVAISEILILLIISAIIGYAIGRIILKNKLNGLRALIAEKELELKQCLAQKPVSLTGSASNLTTFQDERSDDLKKIEGIGTKIEDLLNEAGIKNFARLSITTVDRLNEVLKAAGPRFQMHDPTTWPAQAKLAAEGRWEELKKWQDELNAGKES
ncbi:Predicted 5' DNA nuclease, flap endonuclease-1-like, helix-3-turn-helix (H3TH) domain [Pseudarcicella hirudinis]|uniref:Predicted 5' DNA nuclease, flap endonuclease-1-like, helix-3-turn-helix (H3TH) domain n=1 Tax=Pseudarcicella hirudinis TaxID=1079859 RepID=A0A1I5YG46_9BACT|nr:hypothetical protein [Pseudarcicella hirudinis]SFQ43144.1 Predicted 5' DNA nuclease, flap endonuclease-1-like, helix-3-turn-helix (H3TH) domain [Pseudarcicella hirudinis]